MSELIDAITIEKLLNKHGQQVVSAGLEAEIPIEDIGYRFLAVVEGEEDDMALDHLCEQLQIDHVKEVRIGDAKFYFDGKEA